MNRSHVRRASRWMALPFALAVAACGGDDPMDPVGGGGGDGNGGGGGGGPEMTTMVNVDDNFFAPPANAVSPGATVTWTWIGNNPHNVTFADGSISAPSSTQTDGTFQATMPSQTGTYAYQCTVHAGMNGAVTVQ